MNPRPPYAVNHAEETVWDVQHFRAQDWPHVRYQTCRYCGGLYLDWWLHLRDSLGCMGRHFFFCVAYLWKELTR